MRLGHRQKPIICRSHSTWVNIGSGTPPHTCSSTFSQPCLSHVLPQGKLPKRTSKKTAGACGKWRLNYFLSVAISAPFVNKSFSSFILLFEQWRKNGGDEIVISDFCSGNSIILFKVFSYFFLPRQLIFTSAWGKKRSTTWKTNYNGVLQSETRWKFRLTALRPFFSLSPARTHNLCHNFRSCRLLSNLQIKALLNSCTNFISERHMSHLPGMAQWGTFLWQRNFSTDTRCNLPNNGSNCM